MAISDDLSKTSPSLIERVRAHDADAWRRLCEVYGPIVYGWARAKGLQNTDAADLGQEVFRTVFERIADFRRDQVGHTFRGWLWTITYHKLGDYFRAQGHRPQAVGGSSAQQRFHEVAEDSSNGASDNFGDDAERQILHRVLALIQTEFEVKTWQAFWQTTVDSRPAEQTAAELSLTPQAVRQAKYRVLRRLRTEMREEEPS